VQVPYLSPCSCLPVGKVGLTVPPRLSKDTQVKHSSPSLPYETQGCLLLTCDPALKDSGHKQDLTSKIQLSRMNAPEACSLFKYFVLTYHKMLFFKISTSFPIQSVP
jgi:hypothetical protein